MSNHGRDSKVDIDCHIHWSFVTVYSPHWVNRLRKNRFVWWFCVLTQLWIITAPVIAILERVYEVINPVWWYSHETENATSSSRSGREYSNGRDEAKVADFWAPMMIQAASFRLNEGELLNLDGMERIQRRHREREENLRSSRSEAF